MKFLLDIGRTFQGTKSLLHAVAAKFFGEFHCRFACASMFLDFRRHAVEGFKGAGIGQTRHHLMNVFLGFSTFLPRNEEVLLASGFLDFLAEARSAFFRFSVLAFCASHCFL